MKVELAAPGRYEVTIGPNPMSPVFVRPLEDGEATGAPLTIITEDDARKLLAAPFENSECHALLVHTAGDRVRWWKLNLDKADLAEWRRRAFINRELQRFLNLALGRAQRSEGEEDEE